MDCPVEVTKIISEQKLEINNKNKRKVINVNNVKMKEPDKENIRTEKTITKFGRTSKPLKNL